MLLDGQTPDEPEQQPAPDIEAKEPAAAEIPPPPEPDKQVALPPPKSRRSRIEEEYTTKLTSLGDKVTALADGISARDRQIGELTGHLQALSQQRQYAPPQQYAPPPPQLPDPEDLERKAQECIDRKDFAGYQRFSREAAKADVLRTIGPALQQRMQQQAPQQEQIPPGLMPYFAAYPDVASHPRAMELLAAKNVELGARGFAAGPARVKQIFEDVRATLGGGKAPGQAAYSRNSAGVLTGVPTSRPSNGAGDGGSSGPRVALTTEERVIAKRAGFTEEKMASLISQSHPDRIIR